VVKLCATKEAVVSHTSCGVTVKYPHTSINLMISNGINYASTEQVGSGSNIPDFYLSGDAI
jgi:hypothetical protein